MSMATALLLHITGSLLYPSTEDVLPDRVAKALALEGQHCIVSGNILVSYYRRFDPENPDHQEYLRGSWARDQLAGAEFIVQPFPFAELDIENPGRSYYLRHSNTVNDYRDPSKIITLDEALGYDGRFSWRRDYTNSSFTYVESRRVAAKHRSSLTAIRASLFPLTAVLSGANVLSSERLDPDAKGVLLRVSFDPNSTAGPILVASNFTVVEIVFLEKESARVEAIRLSTGSTPDELIKEIRFAWDAAGERAFPIEVSHDWFDENLLQESIRLNLDVEKSDRKQVRTDPLLTEQQVVTRPPPHRSNIQSSGQQSQRWLRWFAALTCAAAICMTLAVIRRRGIRASKRSERT